jgi:hypothetical protein
VQQGLVVALFRHFDSRTGMPLLHAHAVVSVKVRRPESSSSRAVDPASWTTAPARSLPRTWVC